MKVLALILARGGSQRVPKKNILPLNGKPLIAYTITCAMDSKHINRIIVSTDSPEIAEVAKEWGAEVPFLRPHEISRSDSTELDAFKHALHWLKTHEDYEPDMIVKLFPTAPFRKPESIDACVDLMLANPQADSVRSVKMCSEHPFKMWKIEDNRLKSFVPVKDKPKDAHTLSYQVLPRVYVNNANIDVTKPKTVYEKNSITGTEIIPLVMDELESVDINMPLDVILAEELIKRELV